MLGVADHLGTRVINNFMFENNGCHNDENWPRGEIDKRSRGEIDKRSRGARNRTRGACNRTITQPLGC